MSRLASGTASLLLALLVLDLGTVSNAFQPSLPVTQIPQYSHVNMKHSETALFMADERPEYSRDVRLREEAESPFRKVRFFFYASLAGGAATSLAVSLARIAAASAGVNADLMQESLTNAAVDIGGLVVLGFLYKRDVDAQESRLKRATKGAELAKLIIRGSKSVLGEAGDSDSSGAVTTTLSALRRGRGIEKRVVIATAGKEKLQEIVQDAAALNDSLVMNDLVIVPVVYPQGTAPVLDDVPECVALPLGNSWKTIVDDETAEARKQGVNVENDGISIVLKKNGRVGQRTRGVFLGRMVGEVVERRESGMDVSNI
jgi:hypothetical protein